MKLRKKDKKANLMENSTELVIAILILLILFVAVVKIYTNFLQDRELASAKSVVKVIEQKILDIEENTNVKKTLRGVNGEGWFLTAFDFSDPNRPDACFEKPCIYICKGSGDFREESCKENGVFRRLDVDEILINDYVMEADNFDKLGGGVKGEEKPRRKDYILLPNKLIELRIQKINDGEKALIIEHFSDDYTGSRESGGKSGAGGAGGSH